MGRRIIARQRELIEHRRSVGLCTMSSEGVLATFVRTQAGLEEQLAELRGLRSIQRPAGDTADAAPRPVFVPRARGRLPLERLRFRQTAK
jgi:hypothetical protein